LAFIGSSATTRTAPSATGVSPRRSRRAGCSPREASSGPGGGLARRGLQLPAQPRQAAARIARGGEQRGGAGQRARPVAFEHLDRALGRRARQDQVEVAEAERHLALVEAEILVADVPPADHREPPVGDPVLVVHAPVEVPAAEDQLEHEAQPSVAPPLRAVEQPHLDPGMRIERGERPLAAERIDVVEQHAHGDAAIGGGQHLPRQQPPGQVAAPDIVLQVERAPRGAGGSGTDREGLGRLAHHRDAAVARLARAAHADAGQRRGHRAFEPRRGGAARVVRPAWPVEKHGHADP
jgi:hypothetical protein